MTVNDIQTAIIAAIEATPGVAHCEYYNDEWGASATEILSAHTQPGQAVVILQDGTATVDTAFDFVRTATKLEYQLLVFAWRNDPGSMAFIHAISHRIVATVHGNRWGLPDLGLAAVTGLETSIIDADNGAYRAVQINFEHLAALEGAA